MGVSGSVLSTFLGKTSTNNVYTKNVNISKQMPTFYPKILVVDVFAKNVDISK